MSRNLTQGQIYEQARIIQSGSPHEAFLFARHYLHLDIDIDGLQKVIINASDASYALRFAANIPGADINALQNVVLYGGQNEHIVEFASNVKGADLKPLQDRILETGDGRDLYVIAGLDGADKVAIRDKLVELGGINGDDWFLSVFDEAFPEIRGMESAEEEHLDVSYVQAKLLYQIDQVRNTVNSFLAQDGDTSFDSQRLNILNRLLDAEHAVNGITEDDLVQTVSSHSTMGQE